ncbi:MAG: DEAD/DEAH box helicase [Selenomonadaceae bacterium]|nr:DEAD/DEAH box helicase [Selenomonadaceae bacterium]
MNEYAPGMRIIVRDEEWMIKKIDKNTAGKNALHCAGISPLVRDKSAIFLPDIEKNVEIINPVKINFVADDSSGYAKSLLFLESQWRQKIPNDGSIHIAYDAVMNPLPYQLYPATVALNKPRKRILIADAVGLGKTLEAGILMSELILRGKGKRILVVAVKSTMTQFQKEMWNRFTIPLVSLDSTRIKKIRAALPSNYNPFFYYDKTIVSVDTLKCDIEYRTHLENSHWDIIVIDEAQNVARRGSRQAQRSRLAELLANRSDTMIMLSATPHDGRAQSFASLMNMLDPTAIANPEKYSKKDIEGLYVRRFKKDIKDEIADNFPERNVTIQECPSSDIEEAAYDIFSEMELIMDKDNKRANGFMFKTSLEKALFSSPATCIKSINERINKLKKKYTNEDFADIYTLRNLRSALEKITPKDFSRYQELLRLLNSTEYNWQKSSDDRIVIFTERIETMNYLAEHLKADLKLKADEIKTISGSMSDVEQQELVEQFGAANSKMKILVASDVASEGLNLHYRCHRLIHFDIPWSLMTFQQRNGRIDRYGQEKSPDIRYMLITSKNKRIHGDARIMEILIGKEKAAHDNIGDPAMLMNKFTVEGEENVVGEAIENGTPPEEFGESLSEKETLWDTFLDDDNDKLQVKRATDKTLFSDTDYLLKALNCLNYSVEKLSGNAVFAVNVTNDMRRRLKSLMPEEVLPQENSSLRLSPDKEYCTDEMKESMRNSESESLWPRTQYLWRLHPLFTFINDKTSLLFGRGEAPIVGLNQNLKPNEIVYVVSATIANKKSAPIVDEMFGLFYRDGKFVETLSMDKVINLTGINSKFLANTSKIPSEKISAAESNLQDVVDNSENFMHQKFVDYNNRINPMLDEEVNKLAELQQKHKGYYQALFEDAIKNLDDKSNTPKTITEKKRQRLTEERDDKIKQVDKMFTDFSDWVEETLTIEDKAYIKIIVAFIGL